MIERDVQYEFIYGDAMIDEFEKISGVGSAIKHLFKRPANAAKGMSRANVGRLSGTGIGAGVGAVGGAATDPEDRAGGALRGALLGGVAGLGAGQFATRMGRGQAKRLGQRQLHGVTGYIPRTAQQKARGVSFSGKGLSGRERVESLKRIGMDVGQRKKSKTRAMHEALWDQTVASGLPLKWRKSLAKSEVSGAEARRYAAEHGLTSLPGVAKGLVKNPLKTLKTGFVSQGPAGMALATVPTVAMLPGAIRGKGFGEEYSNDGGIGRMVGETAGYTALGAVPFAPMIAGAAAAGTAGGMIHKGIQKRRRAGSVRNQWRDYGPR